jgi:hypothetical protein
VVASDGPGDYPVLGESRAGTRDDIQVVPGAVVYITTGERRRPADALHLGLGSSSARLPGPFDAQCLPTSRACGT